MTSPWFSHMFQCCSHILSIIFPCVFHDFYITYVVHMCFHDFPSISRGFPNHFPPFPGDFGHEIRTSRCLGGLVEGTDPGLGADQPHRVHRPGDDRGAVSPVSGGKGSGRWPGEEVVLAEKLYIIHIICLYIYIDGLWIIHMSSFIYI